MRCRRHNRRLGVAAATVAQMPLLGTPVRRVEDPPLLLGRGAFVADLDLPGALHAAFVTSPYAHGRILAVEVTEARRAPGVVDVVSGFDLDLGPMPGSPSEHPEGTDRPVLATDRVRFVGEPIVAVVASSPAAAADAAELVVIDIEPLPPVVTPAGALSGEVLLFPAVGSNVMVTDAGGVDGEPDLAGCGVVVEVELVNQRLAPCPIETRVAASYWTDDGRLVHHASCQGPHPIAQALAGYYHLEPSQVRVVTRDVGGSFGAKARLYPEDLLLPLLARRAGRPVRWVPDRSADMVGLGHSRAQRQRVRIGGGSDGRIRALAVDVLADCGAYPVAAPALARNTGTLLPGPFDVDDVRWMTTAVVTNTTPIVAYRGAGRPESGALVNRAVDLFAAAVGRDTLEVMGANLVPADRLPWTNPSGLVHDSGDYHEALHLTAREVGYDSVRAEQQRRIEAGDHRIPGVGLACFVDRTAGVPGSEFGSVELRGDGSVRVLTGSCPYGQGHHTAWAMLVADRTGLALEAIEVVHGDTDVVPRGGITGGSRSAQKAGSAVAEAADQLVAEARDVAARVLEAAPGDVILDVATARFHVAGSPGAATVGWAQVAAARAGADPLRCEADFAGEGPTVPYGAYAAVVEVDTETGSVSLERIVTVDDAGTVLNPLLALGQVHGGVAQAIGQALFEELVYDEDGNPRNASFLDYLLPTAADLPSFDCHLTEHPSPNNPLGFKGIAESGTIGGVPAVHNAVIDALRHLGVRHVDLPLTPQRVWEAIGRARAGADDGVRVTLR
jgi:aerobic carbon-monoxide dehydrogenase large subunit